MMDATLIAIMVIATIANIYCAMRYEKKLDELQELSQLMNDATGKALKVLYTLGRVDVEIDGHKFTRYIYDKKMEEKE